MIMETTKWNTIEISDIESELDIQFDLVTKLKSLWVKCSQNKSICVSRVCEENKLEYWKEEKIKKQTSKKMFIDIFAVKWKKVCIIEMKKSENPDKRQRWYIWAQIQKYKDTGLHVILCEWRKWFNEVIDFFS